MTEPTTHSIRPVKRRRWARFGIRFLLLVVTTSAICLAVLSNRTRSQKESVRQIKQLGGALGFDYQLNANLNWIKDPKLPAPAWLIDLVGEDYVRTVIIVNFDDGSDPTNDDLAVVAGLTGLRQLTLHNRKKVNDEGLRHLAGLYHLERLMLHGTNVQGEGLRHLRDCQNLEFLSLDDTPMTDDGLKHVALLRNLEWLFLSGTQVSDQGLSHLASLGKLKDLQLRDTAVTDEGLKHLYGITSLQRVVLGSNVTSAGRELLQTKLPKCKVD